MYLNAGRREIGDLELDVDGPLSPAFVVETAHRATEATVSRQ